MEDNKIIELISEERLSAYRSDINDSNLIVLARYTWNINLSQAFYAQLHLFEIFLRNRINYLATRVFGEDWLLGNRVKFNAFHSQKIKEAVENLQKNNRKVEKGRVIAELNLGFWTGLFGHEYYNHFMSKIIVEIFPNLEKSKDRNQIIRTRLKDIRKLRNRVFHYEPVFNSKPSILENYINLVQAIAWIYSDPTDFQNNLDSFNNIYNDEPK